VAIKNSRAKDVNGLLLAGVEVREEGIFLKRQGGPTKETGVRRREFESSFVADLRGGRWRNRSAELSNRVCVWYG